MKREGFQAMVFKAFSHHRLCSVVGGGGGGSGVAGHGSFGCPVMPPGLCEQSGDTSRASHPAGTAKDSGSHGGKGGPL